MVTASNLTPLTQRPQWQKLEEHYQTIRDTHLRTLFADDAERGERLALGSTTGGLWVSENQGDSWACVTHTLPPIYAVRFV